MFKYNLPKKFSGVRIISSEVSDGSMSDALGEGDNNLKEFIKAVAPSLPFCLMRQIHSVNIKYLEKSGKGGSEAKALLPPKVEDGDGILTQKNFVLVVKTADCIPLLLFEKNTGLIGAVHVSRKNLLAGIINISFKNVLEGLKVNKGEVFAFLGPHIRVENYKLKANDIAGIRKSVWHRFLINFGLSEHFDLTRATIFALEEIGLKRQNIFDSKLDTYNSKNFFSSRKQNLSHLSVFATVIFKSK